MHFFFKDKDGFIERAEMTQIVQELALDNMFPENVIDEMFLEADVDGDGKISFEGKKKKKISTRKKKKQLFERKHLKFYFTANLVVVGNFKLFFFFPYIK